MGLCDPWGLGDPQKLVFIFRGLGAAANHHSVAASRFIVRFQVCTAARETAAAESDRTIVGAAATFLHSS